MILWNQALPFWDELDDLKQLELLDCTVVRAYNPGEAIRIAPGFFLVNDGEIVAYETNHHLLETPTFKESFLRSFLLPPELFTDNTVPPLRMIALEESEICYIPYTDWLRLEQSIPQVAAFAKDLRYQPSEAVQIRGIAVDPSEAY